MIHFDAYRLVTLPRVVADLVAGPEPEPRLETVDEVERWLRQQSRAWKEDGLRKRLKDARRLLLTRWRYENGRLSDGN